GKTGRSRQVTRLDPSPFPPSASIPRSPPPGGSTTFEGRAPLAFDAGRGWQRCRLWEWARTPVARPSRLLMHVDRDAWSRINLDWANRLEETWHRWFSSCSVTR